MPFLMYAATYGASNVAIQAIDGNINSFGDAAKAFGIGSAQGAIGFIMPGANMASMTGTQMWSNAGLRVLASQVPGTQFGPMS